jgi:hypothetical protein
MATIESLHERGEVLEHEIAAIIRDTRLIARRLRWGAPEAVVCLH